MKTLKNLISVDKSFLYDLIKKNYLNEIIMFKTWDNEFCRRICIQIINIMKKSYLLNNKLKTQRNNLNQIESMRDLIQKINIDFIKLKEFCDFGCIHKDIEYSVDNILLLSKEI